MQYSQKWETILSIVIVVVIISIILLSLVKIVEYDNELNYQYDKTNYVSILEKNTNALIKQVDTSNLKEKEVFYLYKTGSQILALSWAANENLKYINYLWENVNSWVYIWAVYSRFCLIEKDALEWQMIKCSIKELIRK